MSTLQTVGRCLLMAVAIFSVASRADTATPQRQYYSKWEYDKECQRFVVDYHFKSNAGDSAWKKRCIVHYPQGDRKNYVYFYNLDSGTYWGPLRQQAPSKV